MALDKVSLSAKLQNIHRLDEIRAVAPGGIVGGEDRRDAAKIAAEKGGNVEEAEIFEKAGWTFVKATHADSAEADHGVVVDGDGHLKILSNALNVKFDPTLSRNAVEEILGQHKLSIRRDMGFSPNLFLVMGIGGDAVSKAKSLNQLDSVLYAEPVLIEAIKGR